MPLSLKKSVLLFGGAGAIGGSTYYFFFRDSNQIITTNKSSPIPRDRSNLRNVVWSNKATTLKNNKQPESKGLQAAKSWTSESIEVAIRWLKLACEDPTETINDEEWHSYCEA